MEEVVLVDENDNFLGTKEKLQAHKEGNLHRAISVFIFNSSGKLLIQKRNRNKYHSGGLWANTCCSHPRPNEDYKAAASRRLREETGIVCELKAAFSFIYEKDFENGLTEHELDHVFIGTYDGEAMPNPKEIEEVKFIGLDDLSQEIESHPDNYAFWLKEIMKKHRKELIKA